MWSSELTGNGAACETVDSGGDCRVSIERAGIEIGSVTGADATWAAIGTSDGAAT